LLDFLTMQFQEIAPQPAPVSQTSSYMPGVVLSKRNPSWWNAHVLLHTQGQHFPDAFARPRARSAAETREDPGRKCIYCCGKRVLTFCKQCGVFLRLGRCFHDFHTLHNLNDEPQIHANADCLSESASD
jgi:hypothetical protein